MPTNLNKRGTQATLAILKNHFAIEWNTPNYLYLLLAQKRKVSTLDPADIAHITSTIDAIQVVTFLLTASLIMNAQKPLETTCA